jgi:hypothetical protein
MGFVMDNTATMAPVGSREGERVNPIVRVLPSLTDVAVIFTILFVFTCMGGTRMLLGDGDTGWHIRTGQWILAHGRVPSTDLFSYTMPGRPWFAWEWLWDVSFAKLYEYSGGMAGVVIGSLVVLCLTSALLFRMTREYCGNVLIAFVVTAAAIAGSAVHWLARPHLFTLLFGVICYWIVERCREALAAGDTGRARRLLAILPAMTVPWVNLHGGFVFELMLLGAYAAAESLRWLCLSDQCRAARTSVIHYAAAMGACFVASLLNPYGINEHRHILEYLHDPYLYEHIMEFQSMSFHHPLAMVWEVMMVLAGIAAYREIRRKQFVYPVLLAGWAHLGLVSGRNLPIFLLVAAPIVAKHVGEMLSSLADAPVAEWVRRAASNLDRLAADVDETDRIGRLHLASVAAVAVVAALIFAPHPPEKFRAEFDPKRYPAKALEFLGKPGIQNRIFTDDEWGDYLIYKMYPTKAFMDGRSDFYGTKFCQNHIEIMGVKYDWEQRLAKYGVDTILLSPATPLATTIKASHKWRAVYDDGVAIIFRPAGTGRNGEQVSVVQPDSGTGRDRKITKSQKRDPRITNNT